MKTGKSLQELAVEVDRQAKAIKGGDLSTYGMVQAVTRTSQDIADYDRATEFERIGGEILAINLN